MPTAFEMRETRFVRDLLDALGGTEELVVHYMPTVDLADGTMIGVEALVRWQHPELGLLPPMDFVPLAERHEMALILGEYVRRRVVADIVAGRLPTNDVAVNVSGAELNDAAFTDRLLDLLDQHGLDPGRLTVEVTETALAADVDRVAESLLRLRAAGILVAIDDFGTGHASLSYLANLPCDIVKIDRRFTAGIGVDDRCTAIVHGVISMAHELGLTVVAEGIETVDQRDQLLALNCQQGQGYLFGKAVPAPIALRLASSPSHPAARRRLGTLNKKRDPIRAQLVLDLANEMAHCTDLLEAFECLLRALRPNIVFTGGSVQLIGPDGIRLAVAHPPPTADALAARLPVGHGVGWAIVASGELRYIPDITELATPVPSAKTGRPVTRDTRSYLGVPLVVDRKAIGLVQIDSVDADAFSAQEQLLMASCACILANAIAAIEARSEVSSPQSVATHDPGELLGRH